MAKTKAAKKGSWIVEVRVEVTQEVICEGCTEDEARDDPWQYESSTGPRDLELHNWEVLKVEPNE